MQLARRITAEELPPPPPPPPNPRKASVGRAFRGALHDAAFEREPPRRPGFNQARAAEARVAPSSAAAPLWKLKLYGLHKRQPLLRQVDVQPTT